MQIYSTTNAAADIREIDTEEPLSNALVPLFQNQSSTAPPDERTLIFSSGRISVTVNYSGGLHCPTQPFAWRNIIEIPCIWPSLVLPTLRITASRRLSVICTWTMTANFDTRALEHGTSLPLARLEEGRNTGTLSTSPHGLLRVLCEDAANSSKRINLSDLHLSTWQSASNDQVKALKTGCILFLARPEEGKHITSSVVEKFSSSSDSDLSDDGHVTEPKAKVRKDSILIINISIVVFTHGFKLSIKLPI